MMIYESALRDHLADVIDFLQNHLQNEFEDQKRSLLRHEDPSSEYHPSSSFAIDPGGCAIIGINSKGRTKSLIFDY